MTNIISEEYEFDDVLILPNQSNVDSRTKVVLNQEIVLLDGGLLEMGIPIIASPMEGITSTELLVELRKLGGIGILHRGFIYDNEWESAIKYQNDQGYEFGIAVGMTTSPDWIYDMINKYNKIKIVCVDVANGHNKSLLDYIYKLTNILSQKPVAVMSGNVVTYDGAFELYAHGCHMVRVGIGGGSLCTTRNETGIGRPQFSAIIESKSEFYDDVGTLYYTIADGGIRNSGDMCKALAGGADFVMLGGILGKTFESGNKGVIYGMASKRYQDKVNGNHLSIEGIEKKVEKEFKLKDMLDAWMGHLASSMSYVGAWNLYDFRRKAKFVKTGTGSIDHSKKDGYSY